MTLPPYLAVAMAYLVGSILFGIYIGKAYGADPRTAGSGRTGASNVYRATKSSQAKWLTVLMDVMKGAVAVGIASWIAGGAPFTIALAALFVIIGHNYSLFNGFRGGAGTTPNLGALLAIHPLSFLAVGLITMTVWKRGNIASIASLLNSALTTVALLFSVRMGVLSPEIMWYGWGQLLLVVFALRTNIRDLINGRERRVV